MNDAFLHKKGKAPNGTGRSRYEGAFWGNRIAQGMIISCNIRANFANL